MLLAVHRCSSGLLCAALGLTAPICVMHRAQLGRAEGTLGAALRFAARSGPVRLAMFLRSCNAHGATFSPTSVTTTVFSAELRRPNGTLGAAFSLTARTTTMREAAFVRKGILSATLSFAATATTMRVAKFVRNCLLGAALGLAPPTAMRGA